LTDMTTPQAQIHTAFASVLNAEFDETGDPEIFTYQPNIGVSSNSIVLGTVTNTNRKPALGRRVSGTQSGLREYFRIQIDIYNPYGREETTVIMDRITKAISEALDTFRSSYGIHDVGKVLGTVQGPTDPGTNENHGILDYECWIQTEKSD
jgi:hypothetical protein